MNTEVISKEQQDHIVGMIKNVLDDVSDNAENRIACYYMFAGARLALGPDATPPHWIMNMNAGRTDRIFTDYETAKERASHTTDTHQPKEI